MDFNLKEIKLEDLLPQSLKIDEGVICAARALDDELKKTTEMIVFCLIISRIDDLPESIIDLLAWQWHVDYYDYDLPITTKRKLVKESLDWHRIKGTPAAVEKVVTAAFKSAQVQEWYEYGGQPFRFKVNMIKEGMPSLEKLDSLKRSIDTAKNVRSWLEDISFRRDISSNIFYGGFKNSMKKISIYPPKIKLPVFENTRFIIGAKCIHKGVNLLG